MGNLNITTYKDGYSLKPGDKVRCIASDKLDIFPLELNKIYEVAPDHGRIMVDKVLSLIRIVVPIEDGKSKLEIGYYASRFALAEETTFIDVTDSWNV